MSEDGLSVRYVYEFEGRCTICTGSKKSMQHQELANTNPSRLLRTERDASLDSKIRNAPRKSFLPVAVVHLA